MYREKVYLIHEYMRAINKEINKNVCNKIGFKNMNSSTMAVLVRSMEEEPMTLKELSMNVGLANSTVSGIVDSLVEKGLVQRVIDETDRRRVLISAAPKALNIRKEIAEKYTDYMKNVMKNAEEEDIKMILDGLSKLSELVKAGEE